MPPLTRSRRTAACVVIGLVLVGCSSSDGARSGSAARGTTTGPTDVTSTTAANPPVTTAPITTGSAPREYPVGTFDATDAALDQRVSVAGLSGGMIRMVAADGAVIHEHSVGGVTGGTRLEIASSTKWLTAATFMTFVDQGVIGLDDDIAKWLPEFGGSDPPITPRQLMDHTSGVHDNPCQGDGTALVTCVQTLASSPREFPAGTRFSYGNAPLLVVGRLVEVLGGADFATVVRQRLTGPLGMDATTWPGAPASPNPAFGAEVTVDDYGRFLAMILHHGALDGTRVLSASAVGTMVTNQVADYDTTGDYSVGITQIPRYGLGCWPDVQGPTGTTTVVSGNGGMGFYPWVDFASRTWGIVGLQDPRGAQYAVPASQVVEITARTAVDG